MSAVLVYTPVAGEADWLAAALAGTGLASRACASFEEFLQGITGPPDALIVAAEALDGMGRERLEALLERTPDLPLVVLANASPGAPAPAGAVVLERPASVRTLTSTLRALLRLRQRPESLQRLVESNIVGIATADEDHVIDANGVFLEILGYSREEMLRGEVDWMKATPPEHLSRDMTALEQLHTRGACDPFEKEYIRRNGARVPVLVGGVVVAREPKLQWISFAVDLSPQKLAQQLAAASEARFRSLAESLPNLVWEIAPSGVLLFLNRRLREFLGPNRPAGKTWAAIVHPDDHGLANEKWERIRSEGETAAFEIRFCGQDGTFRWFLVHHQAVRDAMGRITSWIASATDIQERREAEEALRRSSERLELAQEATDLGIWDWDPAGDRAYVSPHWRAIYGMRPDTAVSRADWWAAIHPDDRAAVRANEDRALQSAQPVHTEFRIVRADGSARWIENSAKAVTDAAGRPVRLVGTALDITERKRAEEAMQESEERFRALADNMSQLAAMTDNTGLVLWYNRRWYEYTGLVPGAVPSMDWSSMIHPEHLPRVIQRAGEGFAAGRAIEDTFLLRGASGQYRWFLLRTVPVRDSMGQITRWVATGTDVSVQLEAQRALAESTERLRLAKDAAGLGLYDYDVVHGHVEWDERVRELWGVGASEAITYDTFLAGVHPKDREPVQRAVASALDPAGGGLYRAQHRVIHRQTGEVRWILASGQAFFEQGRAVRVVGIAQDVSERMHAEQALHRQAEELARSNAELQQFAYAASHDLREPLRMVAVYTELLGREFRGQLGERGETFIAYAQQGARRMEALLRDLLFYARVSSPSEEIPARPADSSVALDKVLVSFADRFESGRATLVRHRLPSVAAIEAHMVQLFQNLIANALKYTRDDEVPRVEIGAERHGAYWRFWVKDNGIGIDPAHQSRVFLLFQRLHATGKYTGTGVGLAICQRIVQRYGGEIWVESEGAGKGSTFCFTLPAGE